MLNASSPFLTNEECYESGDWIILCIIKDPTVLKIIFTVILIER
jgi:hypothetical protein